MTPPGGRILVVDDEEMIRVLILRHLAGRGLACETAADGRHALALASTGAFDVVLSDIEMPGLDGIGLARDVARTAPSVPIVLLSGKASLDHAVRAMRYGVCDLLLKPFHLDALDAAIDRALARRKSLREGDEYRRVLQKRIEELAASAAGATADAERRSRQVEESASIAASDLDAVLDALVVAVEDRGASPRGHARRTRALVNEAARRISLAHDEVVVLSRAALLHDIGFAALPDAAGAAGEPASGRSPEAEVLHRRHALAGAEILRRAPVLEGAAALVEAHHEHHDGSGWPHGMRGESLPFSARLLAAAVATDEFLCADSSRGRPELEEFLRLACGTRFSPDAVDALLTVPAADFDRIWSDRAVATGLPA